jgi:hypothetical protein
VFIKCSKSEIAAVSFSQEVRASALTFISSSTGL